MHGRENVSNWWAGFVGGHLVDALMFHEAKVYAFNNFATPTPQNIEKWLNNPKLILVKGEQAIIKATKQLLTELRTLEPLVAL